MKHERNFPKLEAQIEIDNLIDCSVLTSGDAICQSFTVTNPGTRGFNNLTVTVMGYYFSPTWYTIERLDPGVTATLDAARIKLSPERLAYLSEEMRTELNISFSSPAKEVASFSLPITIKPCQPDQDASSQNNENAPLTFINKSRLGGWERKLLDLSMRNNMLNLRSTRSILPIYEKKIDNIIPYLKANKLAEIAHNPEEDVSDTLKNIYRTSRTNLEESGSNTLFVVLGSIKWYDADNEKAHIAPMLFIPVTMIRKRAMTYDIRLRDDEPMVNTTLLELMRQMFGITIPELDSLPLDENDFPDWKKITAIFREHIADINKRQPEEKKWSTSQQSYLGIFSFTKYLMWRDIHNHSCLLGRHPVLRGFMEGLFSADSETPSAQKIEADSHSSLMLPIDYDSSQLEAVAECHAGKSFVLHGPPGTGKSQTITNMIADALYNGKRVLFVAEKKAALDVVQKRLNDIGLSRYCLELHSNKTDKRSFFEQLERSKLYYMGQGGEPKEQIPEFREDIIQQHRDMIDGVTKALHQSRKEGVSLYQCIGRFVVNRYAELSFNYEQISHLTPADISMLRSELAALDLVEEIMGFHPSQCDLLGFYPKENTLDNQSQIVSALANMDAAIAAAKRKALGWINRWFLHKTPEEILRKDPIWLHMHELATASQIETAEIDEVERIVDKWRKSLGLLRNWYHFSEKVNAINGYNVPGIIEYYAEGRTGESTSKDLESAYYHSLAINMLDNDDTLRVFNGLLQDTYVDAYRLGISQLMTYRRKILPIKMEKLIRETKLSDEELMQFAILRRRTFSGIRNVTVRKTISEASLILQKLFPCMLMSPLSVAQYLEMRPGMFDVIIFDEASQMETPDAIGAIARGGSVIVVGDPKQLPPTRFFTAKSTSGEEIEESEDSDSILDDCIALGLPSRYLSRHYRSRHESLISFSNRNFYDNRLLTFPSFNDAERKVRLIDPKGVYDRSKSRTNRIEAEAVVKYILKLVAKSDKAPSIGVVAFSKQQSNLIEDTLNSELIGKKAIQQKLDSADEPMFIKNLENVQGDERDIIIFSIGYGPDANGNVALNFGPINQNGGERRLNVAVTRARESMAIFSSLQPKHIPTEGVTSKGVKALRNFLLFAMGETAGEDKPASEEISDQKENKTINDEPVKENVIEDIAERLRAEGLEVRTHIGRSSFKVDIAIVDPANPSTYKCGIIVDGRDYSSLPTVRDREITMPSALTNLGWNMHRIWSIDWLENPDKIIKRILGKPKKKAASKNTK